MSRRIDLFARMPRLKALLQSRGFQFWVILPNFVLFYLFILAGLFGSPVGNRNIMIVFVWILWWVLLISLLVPFASRIWCTICPLPVVGEWLQRMSMIRVRSGDTIGSRNRLFGLNRRWPKKLKNIWLQNIGFLCLAVFSALLVTRPIVSVAVLGGMIVISTALMLVYRQRAFCMYLCPVGGFLGLYSMTSTLEMRARDTQVCKDCRYKNCVRGSDSNYGCPWFQYPGSMERNNYCGLCTECAKNCPYDNISLQLRPFGSDTRIKDASEAWKALIMVVLAMFYSVTLLGPWGTVKDWANVSEVRDWSGFGIYALAMTGTALVVFPAIYGAFVWLSRWFSGDREVPLKKLFVRYSYAFVPLGLLAWIAFSVPLVMVNGSYIVSVISDPLGWGWNLFGTADFQWTPVLPDWIPTIQIVILMVGLVISLRSTYRVGRTLFARHAQVVRSLVPMSALLTAVTAVFLRLYVG